MCGTPDDDLTYYNACVLNRDGLWILGYGKTFSAKDGDTMSACLVSSSIKLITQKLAEKIKEDASYLSGFEEFYKTSNPINISSLKPLDQIILDDKVQILKTY